MDARPVCPHCGEHLFARSNGDRVCLAHGHFLASDVLDSTFGLGSAAHAKHMAASGVPVSRRCPQDRLAMTSVTSAGRNVRAEACPRCGSLWIPAEVVERLLRTTPTSAPTESEARSILGLAAAKAILTPADKAPAKR